MADNILQVKNLKISFRTVSGTVKAVRDISFELKRGETLAIVGESGSGKSVTSKAVLGILAGNSIIEGGEILYDGKDLLKISEDDMHKIRGDKISMIFQDPLSSLDPIVKIGKQITEAMILKNRASRRASKREFNNMLALLKSYMLEVYGDAEKVRIEGFIKTFNSFCLESLRLESTYNEAHTNAEELIADIEDFIFSVEHHQKLAVRGKLVAFRKKLTLVRNPFLTVGYDEKLDGMSAKLTEIINSIGDRLEFIRDKVRHELGKEKVVEVEEGLLHELRAFKDLLIEIVSQPVPNFFRIGYCKFAGQDISLNGRTVEELNEFALGYLDEHFMNDFSSFALSAVKRSFENSLEAKKKVIDEAESVHKFFHTEGFTKKEARSEFKRCVNLVENSIDRLDPVKDSLAYTFRSSFKSALRRYFFYKKNNPKEEARFEKQTKRRDALIAKGKKVDWKVVPKNIIDLDGEVENILSVLDRLTEKYKGDIDTAASVNHSAKCTALIDFFKEKASQVVYRVTKRMAREKAIKLMEEVGIPEPRIRFYQYPFEFSGGMRQRIVIAIALAANPDLLICDEPTTALDVTIQAQILEQINKLKDERNLSVIFITHDLGVVANMADRVAVMYAGKIVEYGTADDIFYDPRHPYTWALLSSMPDLDTKEKLEAIPGTPPNMIYPPKGDAFAERNKYAMKIDFEQQPPMFEISPTHYAATWLLHPDAPKVAPPKAVTDRIARMKASMAESEERQTSEVAVEDVAAESVSAAVSDSSDDTEVSQTVNESSENIKISSSKGKALKSKFKSKTKADTQNDKDMR